MMRPVFAQEIREFSRDPSPDMIAEALEARAYYTLFL